jgi:hypothetical protein
MRTTVDRQTRTRVQPFREGRTDVIALVTDDGIARVRLARVRQSLGLYQGEPHTMEDCLHLDGIQTRTTIRLGRAHRERSDMTIAAIPVRSQDVTDFGRLQTAATTLSVAIQQFGPTNRPSPEQAEAIVRSYQGLLEWRRKAREKMTAAEGQIDLTEALLKAMLAL